VKICRRPCLPCRFSLEILRDFVVQSRNHPSSNCGWAAHHKNKQVNWTQLGYQTASDAPKHIIGVYRQNDWFCTQVCWLSPRFCTFTPKSFVGGSLMWVCLKIEYPKRIWWLVYHHVPYENELGV
jgi:hypothetical protein